MNTINMQASPEVAVATKQVKREDLTIRNWKHGCAIKGRELPEYSAWCAMRRRCDSDKVGNYADYGGRGIGVCSGLRDFPSFIAVLGRRPTRNHQIDRPSNDDSYACGECDECQSNGWDRNAEWATRSEQCNNRRSNVNVIIDGVEKTATQWARIKGVPTKLALSRIRAGMDPVLAVTLQKEEAIKHGASLRSGFGNGKSKPIFFNGESHTLSEWARIIGIHQASLRERIDKYGLEKALTTPKGVRIQ